MTTADTLEPLTICLGRAQSILPVHNARARHLTAVEPDGFTLIELMVVVAIIAILTMIAYPSYRQHIVRAHRSAAQSLMLDLANREQQWFAANRTYATDEDLRFSMPDDLSSFYTHNIALIAGPPPGFTITFTPVVGGVQATDGALTLDGVGNKTPADKWLK